MDVILVYASIDSMVGEEFENIDKKSCKHSIVETKFMVLWYKCCVYHIIIALMYFGDDLLHFRTTESVTVELIFEIGFSIYPQMLVLKLRTNIDQIFNYLVS